MMKKYKLKSIQVYSSDEWMADATKRYRTVFERQETSYLRCELAFYNKLFDEEDWSCQINLKGLDISPSHPDPIELCNLHSEIKVSKEDNIVYVRDGWGNASAGAYWKKGTYKWEAYIDGELIGTHVFHVEDVGIVTGNSNPYLHLEYIKLFAGDFNGWQQRHRKYLKAFNKEATQYVWAEFKIKNLTDSDYHYEFVLNYYDDAGLPKAKQIKTGFLEAGKKNYTFTFDLGWGNNIPGSWKDDKYTLEIVFMDVLIGAVSFDCKNAEEEGVPPLLTNVEQSVSSGSSGGNSVKKKEENVPDKSLDELLIELDALIGLEDVKQNIRENITYLNFTKLRKEKGFLENSNLSLHSVFTGNPGTGKTTIVKMLGKIYHKMGLLSKGHVVEVDRVSLVGEFIGQTAPKTKKAIESARGGLLFIDEAYSLARADDDSKDFGKEAIEILLKEMSDGPGDIAIVVAGYPKEMKTFIDSNPGLKSRFTQFFHFDDYLPEELYKISLYTANNKQVQFTPDADVLLKEQLTEMYRKRDESFGNARMVNAVVEEAKINMGLRLMKVEDMNSLDKDVLSTITVNDLQQVFAVNSKKTLKLAIHEKQLQEALTELNELVGMENIKQDVNELVKLIRFYNEVGKDVVSKFSLHSVFTGNPGTGKTTVARILSKIYKSLGILERGHVVEVDREGLVAGFVGQTAPKTQERIEEAMGGILFIDEAYSLSPAGASNDYGKEAIEIILKRMEDHRGKFGVIVAGYPDNMHQFIETNPGLKSRFDKVYHFFDYGPEQLLLIAANLLEKESLKPTQEALDHLNGHLAELYEKRDKYFGNARSVRQIIGDIVKKQNLRMASIPSDSRTLEDLNTLTLDDVKHLHIEGEEQRGALGFRYGGN